ncbi:MAG: hypothetical protein KBG48_11065 [Kofleriaceae bacterium]|nr:hypothetical protein [Kofleriaceae bacterium]MBP9167923.1 hypothetical protein [Kofleriaceae bacterium]MBP9856757.1 hypothetical protein [Kofleriaceae bacterium]
MIDRSTAAATTTLTTAAALVTALVAGSADATAATNVSPPTGYTIATMPIDATTNPGTWFPRFAGQLPSETLVRAVMTTQGDTRTLLDWSRCPQLHADGTSGPMFATHCLAFTVGTHRAHTTYLLTDLACANPSNAACYGGYVVAGRLDLTATRTSAGAETTVAKRATLRVGWQRKSRRLDGTWITTYTLPTTPVLTLDQTVTADASHREVALRAVDALGTVVLDHGYTEIASGGLSCADQYELALADGQFYGAVFGTAAAATLVVAGTAAGIAVAVFGVGATLGAGTAPALAAGGAVAGAGAALGATAYYGISDAWEASARADAILQRDACQRQQAIDDFTPEELPAIDSELATSGGGSELSAVTDAVACDQSEEYEVEIDGATCQVWASQDWVDGECKDLVVIACPE